MAKFGNVRTNRVDRAEKVLVIIGCLLILGLAGFVLRDIYERKFKPPTSSAPSQP
jgi:hypothetical protein